MEASGHINVQVTGNSENIQILTLRSSQRIPKAKLRLVDIYLEGNFIDVKLKNSGGDSAFVTRALIQIFSDPDIIQNCIQTGAMEYVYSMEFGGQKVGIRGQIFGFENLISAI